MAGKAKANENGKFENRVREAISEVLEIDCINYGQIKDKENFEYENIIINNNPTMSRWSAMLKNGHQGDGMVYYRGFKFWLECKHQTGSGSVWQKYDFVIGQIKMLPEDTHAIIALSGEETKGHVEFIEKVLQEEKINHRAIVLHSVEAVRKYFNGIKEVYHDRN